MTFLCVKFLTRIGQHGKNSQHWITFPQAGSCTGSVKDMWRPQQMGKRSSTGSKCLNQNSVTLVENRRFLSSKPSNLAIKLPSYSGVQMLHSRNCSCDQVMHIMWSADTWLSTSFCRWPLAFPEDSSDIDKHMVLVFSANAERIL